MSTTGATTVDAEPSEPDDAEEAAEPREDHDEHDIPTPGGLRGLV